MQIQIKVKVLRDIDRLVFCISEIFQCIQREGVYTFEQGNHIKLLIFSILVYPVSEDQNSKREREQHYI